jgi:hypothetical protein
MVAIQPTLGRSGTNNNLSKDILSDLKSFKNR